MPKSSVQELVNVRNTDPVYEALARAGPCPKRPLSPAGISISNGCPKPMPIYLRFNWNPMLNRASAEWNWASSVPDFRDVFVGLAGLVAGVAVTDANPYEGSTAARDAYDQAAKLSANDPAAAIPLYGRAHRLAVQAQRDGKPATAAGAAPLDIVTVPASMPIRQGAGSKPVLAAVLGVSEKEGGLFNVSGCDDCLTGMTRYRDRPNLFQLEFSAEKLDVGSHTLTLEAIDGDRVTTTDLKLTVLPPYQQPYRTDRTPRMLCSCPSALPSPKSMSGPTIPSLLTREAWPLPPWAKSKS